MSMKNEDITFYIRHLRDAGHIDVIIATVTSFQEKMSSQQTLDMQEWIGFLKDYAVLRGIAELSSNHKPDFFQSGDSDLNKRGITPEKIVQCKKITSSFEQPVKNLDDIIQLFTRLGSPALANSHKIANKRS